MTEYPTKESDIDPYWRSEIDRLLAQRNKLLAERDALRERLGCAIEELERRHPLDADPLTAAIVRDGRAALERIQ